MIINRCLTLTPPHPPLNPHLLPFSQRSNQLPHIHCYPWAIPRVRVVTCCPTMSAKPGSKSWEILTALADWYRWRRNRENSIWLMHMRFTANQPYFNGIWHMRWRSEWRETSFFSVRIRGNKAWNSRKLPAILLNMC